MRVGLVARLAGRTAPGLQVNQLDAAGVDHDLAGPLRFRSGELFEVEDLTPS